jgi:hypothetical protein
MRREFLTYFDINYASCGMALVESLFHWCEDVRVTILGLDEATLDIVSAEMGDRVAIVTCADLAAYEPALLPLRTARTPWEFYATQKPVFIDRALRKLQDDALVTYTDADTFFFSDPSPIFAEATTASIVISPHRFNAATAHLAVHGRYNAGFGLWRNDVCGRQCLRDWTRACLAWCYARVEEDGRFMNQGYLNAWPVQYEKARILSHPGANLAPWNVGTHRLKRGAHGVLVDGVPLIFYHFANLSRNAAGEWQTYDQGKAIRQAVLHKAVYGPYIMAVEAMARRLKSRYGVEGLGSVRTVDARIPQITFQRMLFGRR